MKKMISFITALSTKALNTKTPFFATLTFVILSIAAPLTWADSDHYAKVEIKVVPVAKNIYMLKGAGGNLGVFVGEDGTLLIDDQFAPLNKKIIAAIESVAGSQPDFVVNTHWHGDHTGGNEAMGKGGSIIVAHDNVRERMSTEQASLLSGKTVPASPDAALPTLTFDREITFHWNGDKMRVMHVQHAHTDGDAIIFFEQANVVHMGDVFFNGFYPYIDAGSGGSIKGVYEAVDKILSLIDDDTKVIPGHGGLSNRTELTEYRDMLQTMYQRIKSLKDAGRTVEQVVAAKPSATFDKQWGNGFIKPDKWVTFVYMGIQ